MRSVPITGKYEKNDNCHSILKIKSEVKYGKKRYVLAKIFTFRE